MWTQCRHYRLYFVPSFVVAVVASLCTLGCLACAPNMQLLRTVRQDSFRGEGGGFSSSELFELPGLLLLGRLPLSLFFSIWCDNSCPDVGQQGPDSTGSGRCRQGGRQLPQQSPDSFFHGVLPRGALLCSVGLCTHTHTCRRVLCQGQVAAFPVDGCASARQHGCRRLLLSCPHGAAQSGNRQRYLCMHAGSSLCMHAGSSLRAAKEPHRAEQTGRVRKRRSGRHQLLLQTAVCCPHAVCCTAGMWSGCRQPGVCIAQALAAANSNRPLLFADVLC
jgi:hypothetical protein